MDYKSVGIAMTIGASNRTCLTVAAELAERFNARVIGMAATVVPAPLYYTDGSYGAGIIESEEAELRKSLANAEDEFRQALSGRIKHIEWRSDLRIAKDFVPEQSRSVDVIVMTAQPESQIDPYLNVSPSDLVMEAGRPILVVPPSTTWLDLRRIMVAWKDTRESRRAVADALPLLQKAKEVTVAEVCSVLDEPQARERVDDVAAWLLRHGVAASAITAEDTNTSENLDTIASNMGAGLIVAGAYGHSRLRQWVLGGVTHRFVTAPSRCVLLSR
ncbi:Universal stress protein family OS=Afipia felis OX=1035 GN=NCTC12722_02151 PE=4 SV=1 [Afipia felis]